LGLLHRLSEAEHPPEFDFFPIPTFPFKNAMKPNLLTRCFTDLLDLFYPNLCLICNESLLRGEEMMCLHCLHGIPKTNYHLQPDNTVEKRFWGKVPLYRGTSFFFFQKGSPFQKLLHELKYKGNKEIGEIVAKYAAADLLNVPDFCSVDVIVPVPLHPRKYARRGYNQSEWIAKGLAAVLNKPIDTRHLRRIRESATQTKKSVFDRYKNTQGIFQLTDTEVFGGKHVLLVDDVLTTGSTLEACMEVLLVTENIKISIFTLAVA
jgi:ComF family protein